MRALALLASCLLSLTMLAPLATAAPSPLTFADAAGDATQGSAAASGPVADGVDILDAGFEETGDLVRFHLDLVDLDAMVDETSDNSFHVQYALSFTSSDGGSHSARALFGGLSFSLPSLDGWRFQWHDRNSDEWVDADGRVDGDRLVWDIDPTALSMADGDTLAEWSVQTWAARDGAQQIGDWAATPKNYILGEGVVNVQELAGGPGSLSGVPSDILLFDPKGDVERDGRVYNGPGAPATDILRAAVAEIGKDLVFSLDVADLEAVKDEADTKGYHVQYALSFITRDGHAGYSLRAVYEGHDRNRNGGDGWRLNMHDRQSDLWPDVHGWMENSTLVWRVPRHMFDVTTDSVLRDLQASTWASADDAQQYGDRAESEATYIVGAPTSDATMGLPEAGGLDAFVPGPGAVVALGLLGAAAMRRRQ